MFPGERRFPLESRYNKTSIFPGTTETPTGTWKDSHPTRVGGGGTRHDRWNDVLGSATRRTQTGASYVPRAIGTEVKTP